MREKKKRILLWVLITLSFVGIIDAGYLTISHYAQTDVICSILDGCNVVLGSSHAVMFGIPVALLGLFFYITLFFALLYILGNNIQKILYPTLTLPFVGLCMSAYFVYLQVFVINALCLYCMVSAIINLLLSIVSGILISTLLRANNE